MKIDDTALRVCFLRRCRQQQGLSSFLSFFFLFCSVQFRRARVYPARFQSGETCRFFFPPPLLLLLLLPSDSTDYSISDIWSNRIQLEFDFKVILIVISGILRGLAKISFVGGQGDIYIYIKEKKKKKRKVAGDFSLPPMGRPHPWRAANPT